MTEQLKKAAKSVFVFDWDLSNDSSTTRNVYNIGVESLPIFGSIYSYHNYTGLSSKPVEKGKTNWVNGDLVTLKAYLLLRLNKAESIPDVCEFDIYSQYFSYEANNFATLSELQTVSIAKTRDTGDRKSEFSPLHLDILACQCKNNLWYVRSKQSGLTFSRYETSALTKVPKVLTRAKLIIETDYIGTEQADGSIVYLA